MSKSKIILFDIDSTLFNARIYLELSFDKLSERIQRADKTAFNEILEESYEEMRHTVNFSPKALVALIIGKLHFDSERAREMENVFWEEILFTSNIYSDVVKTLEILKKENDMRLGIFSTGDLYTQQQKIKTLKRFFNDEDIHIFPNKDIEFPRIINIYSSYNIYLVDDATKVLDEAKRQKKPISTIWIVRDPLLKDQKHVHAFTPQWSIDTLEGVLSIVRDN